MKHPDLLGDATEVQLTEEISERWELMNLMVGNLYPSILQCEIDRLCQMRGELISKRLDAERAHKEETL